MVVAVFKGGFHVQLQIDKHLTPLFKMVFRVMFISLLLHLIMSHENIIIESTKNITQNCKSFFNLLYLGHAK
jgi:hypothetical protein